MMYNQVIEERIRKMTLEVNAKVNPDEFMFDQEPRIVPNEEAESGDLGQFY